MEIIVYAIIFIIGTFFGSFFTLAVYRIPRGEDILIKHSYCPNCNHKLGFFDLFPILSYIFLKGKCRYCNNPIRIRYFLLEIFSGAVFLLIAISMNITINNFNIPYLILTFIYISVLFIIAGIDKEMHKIQHEVLFFGYLIEFAYIIYICTFDFMNVYKYVIYFLLLIMLLIVSIIKLRKDGQESYYLPILGLSIYMILFGGSLKYVFTAILTLLTICFINKSNKEKLPIGFYLVINNLLTIIVTNFICNFVI